jgi:3-phenylpropionate/cinnamic acid dioxygenase small subunit
VEAIERLLAQSECRDLCVRFARCLDTGDFETLFTLFTPDGVFDRMGQVLRGRDEMRAAYRERPAGIRSRHLVTNVDFIDMSADRAEAHVYNLVFHTDKDDGSGNPLQYITENGRFLDFHDHYRLTDHGWRFASRTASVVFVPRDWQDPV